MEAIKLQGCMCPTEFETGGTDKWKLRQSSECQVEADIGDSRSTDYVLANVTAITKACSCINLQLDIGS